VKTGHILQSLPVGTPLWLNDQHSAAQDWNSGVLPQDGQLTITIVHALKTEFKYIEQAAAVRVAWAAADVEYLWRPLTAEQLAAGGLLVCPSPATKATSCLLTVYRADTSPLATLRSPD
jgi:hypothetical protein